ncbi:MAG TPA: PAS domain S-box protein [Bryobacteraceae bacterium]|nr:PAS domain S-box protein [Bryobacteraceae bacterium]
MRSWLRWPAHRGLLYAVLTAAILLPLWMRFDHLYRDSEEAVHRARIRRDASSQADSIAAAVNRRLTLLEGLYAFVQSQLGSQRFESDLRSFSAGMHAALPGMRAIEVIPDGVIKYVYPLEGNEAAVGLDLNSDPRGEIRADLERARDSGRHTVTGPLVLKQGGLGLIARRAVFREGRFWGYVTVILDVTPIIREAAPGSEQIRFALRDSRRRVFYGDPAIFSQHPVVERAPLPDGFWELAAVPVGGWSSATFTSVTIYRVLGLSLVLAICIVVYLGTERQYRLARAVRAGEEQYRLVTESVPVLISSFDNNGRCRFANLAHESWFGAPAGELVGKTVAEILGEDVARRIRERKDRLAERLQVSFDAEITTASGSKRQVSATCVPQVSEDSAFDGYYLVATDITDRKRAETELRRSQARLARAQSIAHIGSWELDLSTMQFQCSDEACRILDLPCDDKTRVPSEQVMDRVSPRDRDRVEAVIVKALQTGSAVDLEHAVARADGSERIIHLQSESEFENGKTVRVTGTVQDVTEYRHLEAQLRQAQKMEAIGQLAGGIAHDFNNLLSVISGYTELALTKVPESDLLREDLLEIRTAGERAAALTRQLLAFSRRQRLQPGVLNLNSIVEELEKLLCRLIGENISLVTRLDSTVHPVIVDAGQMEQVIVNLVVNARDAMPGGGTLTIETAELSVPDPAPENSPVGPGVYAVLRIIDTGTGIPPEVQPRIFEPFFTTKEQGKGTGLGLSMVYGIVKQSGGEVSFMSAPGHGSTFSVFLPVTKFDEPAPDVRPVTSAVRGTETILLVEDEDAVRSLVTVLLRRFGYKVLTASHPAEAIELMEQHTDSVHLLLTDVIMPGMSGAEMAEQLRRLRPDLKIVFMSGYIKNETVDRAILSTDVHFIQKPFSPDALAETIRAALTSETPQPDPREIS